MPQKKRGSTVPHKQAAPAPKKPCTEAAAAITGDTAAAGPAVATEIDRHVETIAQMWCGIQQHGPLSVQDGAALASFSLAEFRSRINDGRAYKCCCPIFMLNLAVDPTPDVPVCSRQVTELVNHFFATAPNLDNLPEITVEAPPVTSSLDAIWGTVRQVSPIETTIAFLQACARDIKQSKDLNVLEQWRKALLAVQMTFKTFEDKTATFMHSVQLRQDAMQQGTSLQRTPLQWACEIMAFREMIAQMQGGRAPGGMALADRFAKAGLKFASTSEPPTKTFIDNVVTIHNRMLSVPHIKAALLEADELFGPEDTPFKKVNTLHIITTKACSEGRIYFVVALITKLVHGGVVSLRSAFESLVDSQRADRLRNERPVRLKSRASNQRIR